MSRTNCSTWSWDKMRVIQYEKIQPGKFSRTAFTIGAFDGVHLGHREVFRTLVSEAKKRSLKPMAITFQPLPREYFGKKKGAIAILSFEERKRRMESCGLSAVLVIHFSKALAEQAAASFMDDLRKRLDPKLLVIGHDFRIGRGKEAGEDWIRNYCEKNGIALKVVRAVKAGMEIVSSSRIRALLKEGKLPEATKLLGEPYQLEGTVVSGHHRGKSMGFATANLVWKKELLIPTGIYAAWAGFDRSRCPAAVNIGFSPTFGERQLGIEAHLLGFSKELYGRNLRLTLVKRLRDEIKFPSVAALVEQIRKDIEQAKSVLGLK